MKRNILKGLKKAGSPVSPSEERKKAGFATDSKKKQRNLKTQPLPKKREVKEIKEPEKKTEDQGYIDPDRKTRKFEEITLTGSTGKKYKVMIPKSYAGSVPRKWSWNAERYKVAELIAMGIPLAQIPDHPEVNVARMTIYCWLEHPEFREHVDGLVMETGFANQRERIAGLNRLTDMLMNKVINELDGVNLTDKSIGAVLTSIRDTAKLLAQEKQEFVEKSEVKQETDLTASVTNIDIKVEDLLNSKTEEERSELEKDFDKVADEVIRNLTGK